MLEAAKIKIVAIKIVEGTGIVTGNDSRDNSRQ